jgi:hypothetical protein
LLSAGFHDPVGAFLDSYSMFVETFSAEKPARGEIPIPEVPHSGYLVLNQTNLNQSSEIFNFSLPLEQYQPQELIRGLCACYYICVYPVRRRPFDSIEINFSDSYEDRAPKRIHVKRPFGRSKKSNPEREREHGASTQMNPV